MNADYRFGIEEEFFLANAATRGTPRPEAAEAFHRAAGRRIAAAEHEVLQGQVEVSTEPSTDLEAARAVLAGHRARLAETARTHGLLVFAAGTHPTAGWSRQRGTAAERYESILAELRMPGARGFVSALQSTSSCPVPRPGST